MSQQYAKPIPFDRNTVPLQFYPPAFQAVSVLTRENAAASSVTSFHTNATVIEVTAVTTPAAIKWTNSQATSIVTAAGSTTDYDHIVNTSETRRFVIPRSSQAVTGPAALVTQEGLFTGVATKSTGTGSVLLSQF